MRTLCVPATWILICCWSSLCGPPVCVFADEAGQLPQQNEFMRLYNGRDLSGWEVMHGDIGSWQADGELLSCVRKGGGWLRTKNSYSDFILRLEYRIPPGGNSGVGVRFPDEGDPAHVGMEIQILDDGAEQYQNLKAAQYTGGIYYQAAAKQGAQKPPGEWNRYEISCIGPRVKVVLNGSVINDVSVDDYKEGQGGYTPLIDRPRIGHIGMQSHGSRVDFRNLEVKDLTSATPSGLRYIDLVEGRGATVRPASTVTLHYTGRLAGGRKFESSRDNGQPAVVLLSDAIPGWQQGISGMKVGGRRKLIVPPELAYGKAGHQDTVPPGATLVYDIEVINLR